MRTPITRIFLEENLEEGHVLKLPDDEAHHMQKVLRAKIDDVFEVVDAEQNLFIAGLRDGQEAAILERILQPMNGSEEVILYQAMPKGRHMDLVVEKVTEIGIGVIVPLVTERSVVRSGGDGKIDRWRRLALSAARQSLQLRVPQISEPLTFDKALEEAGEEGILLHNVPDLPPLEKAVGHTTTRLFVGPEGGWSDSEVDNARENGLSVAQLGSYRLRSETAGIVAAARAMAAIKRLDER